MQADTMPNLARGLAGRLHSLVRAIDRLDRLESGSGRWRAGFAAGELDAAAAELTFRALRAGANATNFAILNLLAEEDTQSLDRLIAATNLGRLPLSERLNDLVQVGLVTRLIDTDHAQITSAGASLVHLLQTIIGSVKDHYLELARR